VPRRGDQQYPSLRPFPLLALYHIENKGWRGKVVQSVSLGALGERIAKHFGLPFEEVPVGFKHVAERLLAGDTVVGGEESGGYGVQGALPERDGILSGLLLVEMMAATGKSLSQLVKEMERRFGAARFHRFDVQLPRPIWDKAVFVKKVQTLIPKRIDGLSVNEMRTGDGLKILLSDGSWILLRPSGTEPLLRTYAESNEWKKTKRLLSCAKDWALAAL
jgi:phosphomannomutase